MLREKEINSRDNRRDHRVLSGNVSHDNAVARAFGDLETVGEGLPRLYVGASVITQQESITSRSRHKAKARRCASRTDLSQDSAQGQERQRNITFPEATYAKVDEVVGAGGGRSLTSLYDRGGQYDDPNKYKDRDLPPRGDLPQTQGRRCHLMRSQTGWRFVTKSCCPQHCCCPRCCPRCYRPYSGRRPQR